MRDERKDKKEQKQSKENMKTITELTKKIEQEENLKEILDDEKLLKPEGIANKIAQELKDKLKTAQLRKVFDKIKEIENALNRGESYKSKILELYPKLAYSTGRKLMPREFYSLLISLLKKAERNEEDAKIVVKLITAIVAYSKLNDERR